MFCQIRNDISSGCYTADMKIDEWLKQASKKLEAAGIGTARLDALVLLEDVVDRERGWLLSHPELELQRSKVKKLGTQIARRTTHEPLAYIRGHSEFYGREFCIDHRVLEPRPESETMIELLKSLDLPARPTIVDVGTGSGALAITAKLEIPKAQVIGTEIDKKCLIVARRNARLLEADVEFIEGNLLKPIRAHKIEPTALLCNLPYVPDSFQINPAAMAEPRIAIFGGNDGLDVYRKFFKQLKGLKLKQIYVLTEAMPPQHEALAKIAKTSGFRLLKTDDFIQLFVS
jgi:release factor glutamine methyltransferase